MGKQWFEGGTPITNRSVGDESVSSLDKRRKCALCGKRFNVGAYDMTQYAYKVGKDVFCCYTHYSEHLRSLEGENSRKVLLYGRLLF